jgi:enterochelin esterase-like enzyme
VTASARSFRVVILAGVAFGNAMACRSAGHSPTPDPSADAATPITPTTCPPGLAGAPCILALYDRAASCSDGSALAQLHAELDARASLGPLWAGGRALFRTAMPFDVAGDWNGWSTTAMPTAALCSSDLVAAVGTVPSGFHTYKLVTTDGATWSLDPTDPAFAYDGFTGNPDHRNSVLDTPDSGRGHLVELGSQCSTTLGNCRDVTAYLPPGYDAPAAAAQTYPVMFMHDGQNVWDDPTCCFGHIGWQVNTTLDAMIAAGSAAPIVVIAADNTSNRNNEYGLDTPTMNAFMDFQVNELQPATLAMVRGNGAPPAIAGSSLGGLVSMELGLRYPSSYSAIASLSGAFWPGLTTNTGLLQQLPALGKQPLAIYLDSGGSASDNSDGAQDTINVLDQLVAEGWQRADSPSCTRNPNAACYYWQPGATHDELAWASRVWRPLAFLFAP